MKTLSKFFLLAGVAALCSCTSGHNTSDKSTTSQASSEQSASGAVSSEQGSNGQTAQSEQVIKTIMSRRSIRKYKNTPVETEKLEQILNCGINAPSGMNKQSWEVRVINSQKLLSEIDSTYAEFMKANNGASANVKPAAYGAPTLIFIAHDTAYDLSQVDCGLLGANIILSAQSMGLGTCCLGGIVRFMNSPQASSLLKRLELPEGYNLLYAIALGYPDESPAAKARKAEKIKFIE